jgi:hypothetical protein
MAFPKWIIALEKAPKHTAILGSIGVGLAFSTIIFSIMLARGNIFKHIHFIS